MKTGAGDVSAQAAMHEGHDKAVKPAKAEDILGRIIATKREEVAARVATMPLAAVEAAAAAQPAPRDFVAAIRKKIGSGQPVVIAEIKKALGCEAPPEIAQRAAGNHADRTARRAGQP